MNIFAGFVTGNPVFDKEKFPGEIFISKINNSYYLYGKTTLDTSKELVKLFEDIINYDISIETEDKIVFLVDGKVINYDDFSKVEFTHYKSFSYDGFSFDEVVEVEKDFSGIKIIREVEKSKNNDGRIIRVDILS